jgi:hypothetical protein
MMPPFLRVGCTIFVIALLSAMIALAAAAVAAAFVTGVKYAWRVTP